MVSGVIALAICVAWILLSRKASFLFRSVLPRGRGPDPSTGPPEPDRLRTLASRRTLRLKRRVVDDRSSEVAFRFPTAAECKHWAGRLAALSGQTTEPAKPEINSALTEPTPVVLLRQRPTARYQLLGTVEATAGKHRTAEAGLEVRLP